MDDVRKAPSDRSVVVGWEGMEKTPQKFQRKMMFSPCFVLRILLTEERDREQKATLNTLLHQLLSAALPGPPANVQASSEVVYPFRPPAGCPHLLSAMTKVAAEGASDLGDELVHRPRLRAGLEGLGGGEKAQVEDVHVWAIGGLMDDADISSGSCAPCLHLRVVGAADRVGIVFLYGDGPTRCTSRPRILDGRNHRVNQLGLVRLLCNL